ncbi:MAG: TadE/TadG family type IV pilus assembly protein [Novosphingobium sp.]
MTMLKRLLADETGVTVVEFAIISPVLLVMLMGIYDVGYQLYVGAVLQGAIQKAGRDSTIEGAALGAAAIDQRIKDQVQRVLADGTYTFNRKAYATFSNIGKPEDFSDTNSNGVCDNKEPFEDVNGNGSWDTDRGKTGQGGAKDAVVYTVTVIYPRPLAVGGMLGLSKNITLKTETVLRNQPFGVQDLTKILKKC